MNPDDIKALRRELGCNTRELAEALDVEQETVLAWERADQFPTKRHVTRMEELRRMGPVAVPRKKKGPSTSPFQALADPDLWRIMRKLIAHPELRKATAKLAESYRDPADD